MHRALEIGAVLGEALAQGHPLGFVTLTMRHRQGDGLDLLWRAAQAGWQRSISGKGWVSVEPMVDGWVRVWEVTHGRNGWHVHVHCVVVLAPGTDAAGLDRVASGMFGRWSRGLEAAGLDAPLLVGQDWHLAEGAEAAKHLADYLAKSVVVVDPVMAEAERERVALGLGLELTHGQTGRSAEGLATRPVWCLLDDLAETGEVVALRRWHEWESASKAKRQVGWSNGVRERFAPSIAEETDQQIVDQAVGDETDDLVAWTPDQWADFIAHPTRAVELLEVAAVGGRTSVLAVLESWGNVSCSVIEPRSIGGPATGGDDCGAAAEAPTVSTVDEPGSMRRTSGGLGVQPPGERWFPPVPVAHGPVRVGVGHLDDDPILPPVRGSQTVAIECVTSAELSPTINGSG